MLGAIIGDIVGSRFEFDNHRSKDFKLFDRMCTFTDDTVMTCAVAHALLKKKDVAATLRKYAKGFPGRGYGCAFHAWIHDERMGPYNSFGNGAAMRVSSAGWLAGSVEEAKSLSRKATEVTHDHEEGIKGAEATAVCVYMALHGATKDELREKMLEYYPEIASFDYERLKREYSFNETCQNTVPQAFYCFLISNGFEDCLRTSVSIGGDTDTLCAISCAVAESHYGIPPRIVKEALGYLSPRYERELLSPLLEVYEKFAPTGR